MAISKAKKSLFALRLLKRYFTNSEMRLLLDSNFYSVLYYNASIWLTPSIDCASKQSLLSLSATALRSCLMHDGFDVSFEKSHVTHKKCTPGQIMFYQLALILHKTLYNCEGVLDFETITLLDQLVCTGRQVHFQIHRQCNGKIGFNTTANKFYPLNNKINLLTLNMNFLRFKKSC